MVFVVIDIGDGLFDVLSFVYCWFWVFFCGFSCLLIDLLVTLPKQMFTLGIPICELIG